MIVLFTGIFAVSYVFVWQSFYGPEVLDDDYDLMDGGQIVDFADCYLVRQSDGNYLFYFSDFPPEHISKEDVEKGYYEGYPIYEQ